MKLNFKILLLPFPLLFCSIAMAQSVYVSSDFASPQDSFIVSQISLLEIGNYNYQLSGAGVTWDYSSFTPVSQRVTRYIDPNRTGFGAVYLLSCNAFCYPGCYNSCVNNGTPTFICAGSCNFSCGTTCLSNWANKFDLAEVGSDSINLGITTIKDIYNFFDLRQNALEQVAVGARVSGFPVVVEYENPDRVYKFPVEYGNVDSSYSNFSLQVDSIPGISLPISFYYNHGQHRYNTVEGWGTLKTPYGTFNDVLKVKSVVYNYDSVVFQNDTISLADFLPSQIIPNQIVEYKWLSPDYGIPLLKVSAWVINGNMIYQSLDFIDSLRCFDPASVFGYLPFPAIIGQNEDSVEISFYSLSINGNTFEWHFDDENSQINTATGNTSAHAYSEGGIYNVQLITCNNACSNPICDTFSLPVLVIDLSQDTTVGLPAQYAGDDGVFVFPNPFYEQLHISFEIEIPQQIKIVIYDLHGKVMLGKDPKLYAPGTYCEKLDMKSLPSGIYLAELTTESSKFIIKTIKHR